jgi:Caspase domain
MVWGGGFPGQRRSSNRAISVPSGQTSNNHNHNHGGILQNSNNTNHQVVVVNNVEEEAAFLRQAQALIPAEVRMISGCEDEQTSADVSNVASSNHSSILPNPAGRAVGACTSALLKVLYEHHQHQQQQQQQDQEPLSFQQALISLRQELANQGFSQIPQLTSSRPLDVGQTPFTLVGNAMGQRRALLVGINYVGQDGQLRGCHNDVLNVKSYICQVHGFPERDVLILMDDGQHEYPTRENIVRALQKLVAFSQPGDAVFFHYSGTFVRHLFCIELFVVDKHLFLYMHGTPPKHNNALTSSLYFVFLKTRSWRFALANTKLLQGTMQGV